MLSLLSILLFAQASRHDTHTLSVFMVRSLFILVNRLSQVGHKSKVNYLMSITREVLAQSPEPEAHDKVFDNNTDRIGI